MPISGHGNVRILLAASCALFAQSNDFPHGTQNPSSAPDVRQIVDSSIAATLRSWQARVKYTYLERDEDRCVWQLYSAHFGSLFWPTAKLLILR